MTLYHPPTQDFLQKSLDAQLGAGITASATFNNVTNVQNKAGVFIVDRIDTSGNVITPATKREVIAFSGTSGSTVTTLTRGLAGTTDQVHEVGAVVEFVPDVIQQQGILDALANLVTTAGSLDTTKVVDLTTAQTFTNKTITSPIINTPTVASGTFTTPTISGTPGTTAGKLGFDDTNNDLLIGDGSVQQKIRIGALTSVATTVTASSGTITTASGTIRWAQFGRLVYLTVAATITTNGTGSGGVRCALPFTSAAATVLNGRADAVSGKQLQGVISASSSTLTIFNYDNSYPAVSGETLQVSGWVEI